MTTEAVVERGMSQNWDSPRGYPHISKKRRDSFLSWFLPGQLQRDDNVVVYDPLERRLWVDNKANIEG
jgi:hypothetical protein